LNANIEGLLQLASANEPETAKADEQQQAVANAKAEAKLLREKLIEAETYIHEMNQDHAKAVADAEAKQI
jgi:hypothetical protein